MQPHIYATYIRALLEQEDFDLECLNNQAKDTITFTIKNYNEPAGLSLKFFSPNAEDLFKVTGPIGKGLDFSENGTHIAFVAGTGILPLMDFVAFVARKVLKIETPSF